MWVKLTEQGMRIVEELEIPEAVKEIFESIFHEGKLVLFMSYGMSLKKWKESGTLERELKPYRELNKSLEKIFIVTYGDADEPYVEGVGVLYNNTWLPKWLYTLYAPWIHGRILKEADYFKTNQINGGWTAIIAKYLYGKKLIVRQGYPWLQSLKDHNKPIWKRLIAYAMERIAYRVADRIIVTTERDKWATIQTDDTAKPKIHIIPNYIDTNLFKPDPSKRISNRILYVGRMAQEKNLIALIRAINNLDVELIMVGNGEQKLILEETAKEGGLTNATFLGKINNEDLVHEYQKADMFILPSHYEGNPKALLEAMSCGCIVIGTNVRGIKELIGDGETGFLCPEQSSNSIIITINRALFMIREHPETTDKIREKARDIVITNNSLKETVRREICMLRGLK